MPIDPTPPSAGVMTPPPEDKKLPQPDQPGHDQPPAQPDARDASVRGRPQIPASTEVTAADVEDEDDDPVIDNGPGIADGPNTRPQP